MAFGKRGLSEYHARQQAAKAGNHSLPEAVRSLAAVTERIVQAGDGAIGYLVERPELTGLITRFEPADLTAAMTYVGNGGDLYAVLGHIEPPGTTVFSEHAMLHSLAGDLIVAQKAVMAVDIGQLPERPSAEDLESFGEPGLADIVLQAILLKFYLSALTSHLAPDGPEQAADRDIEDRRRRAQADLTAAVRRWASRNMAHHDRAETALMRAKIPLLPTAVGNSAGPGSTVMDGVWVPDEMAAGLGAAD